MTLPTAAAPPTAAPKSRRPASPAALVRLFPRLGPYAGRLSVAGVCLVGAAAVGLAFPLVVRFLLDAAFETRDRALLDRVALLLVGLFAVQGVLNFVQVFLLTSTAERVVARLREDLYSIRRWLGAAESGGAPGRASHADRFRGASGPTESER